MFVFFCFFASTASWLYVTLAFLLYPQAYSPALTALKTCINSPRTIFSSSQYFELLLFLETWIHASKWDYSYMYFILGSCCDLQRTERSQNWKHTKRSLWPRVSVIPCNTVRMPFDLFYFLLFFSSSEALHKFSFKIIWFLGWPVHFDPCALVVFHLSIVISHTI